MRIRFSLPVTGYRIRVEASVPEGKTRPAELLPVHREISNAVTRAVVDREERQGHAISCRKGCSACCQRLFVEITEAEAYRLQETIQTLPEDHRQRIQERFISIREQLLKAGLYDDMLQIKLSDDEARRRLTSAYLDQNIPCPFLEDDACSIYSERPLACREYLVTSPAEECSKPLDGGVRRAPFPWPTFEYALRMTRYPGDERLVSLALLPDWVTKNPEPLECRSGVELLMRSFSTLSFHSIPTERNTKKTHASSQSPIACQIESDSDAQPYQSQGWLVPDYELPDALMVPHYGFDQVGLLEQIASAASRSIGVILLTPDPVRTQAFIDSQPSPERFSLLVAASNTAWIRDRSPIVVRDRDSEVRWYIPRMPEDERGADASLFAAISARPTHRSPFKLARGNLVAGSDGLALSTTLVLEENADGDIQELNQGARQLGIHQWIVFPPFREEPSRHADVHVRFLDENLVAIGWNLSSAEDQASAEELITQLIDARSSLRILRIPIRSEGQRYASPLNWIQLGKELLVPCYRLTEDSDVAQIRQILETEHFRPRFIDSPTLDLGGSLHCLTASIYI